jgi:uncharacterized membrane protein (DUF2068 family)
MTGAAARGDRLVVVIGAFKLVKCALLLGLGLALIWWDDMTPKHLLFRMASWFGALDAHRLVRRVAVRLAALDARAMREIACAALAYAAVFAVEGVGLLLRRRWAEWLTVVVTTSFIPFEIYELARRPGPGKVVALALNAAIAAYLAWRRVTDAPASRAVHRAGGGSHFRAA